MLLDQAFRLGNDLGGPRASGREHRQVVPFEGIDRLGGMDLGRGGGHARGEHPVLCLADQLPAAARNSTGVGIVPTPHGERRGREVERDRKLRITDRFELEQGLPEQTARLLAGRHLDGHGREVHDRDQELDPDRLPFERDLAERPRLLPATEDVQGIAGIDPQEVAVHGLQACRPGFLDPSVGDLDGICAAAQQVEHRREVGMDPEALVELADLGCHPARVLEQADAILGRAPPRHRDRERDGRVRLLDHGGRGTLAGNPDRLAGMALGIRERAVEHQELRQRRQHRGSFRGRLARDELDCPPFRRHRPLVVPHRTAVVTETFVQQPEPYAVAAGIQPGDGRLRERDRTGRPAGRERGLGGLFLQLRRILRAGREVQRLFDRGECVRRRVARRRLRGRCDVGAYGLPRRHSP